MPIHDPFAFPAPTHDTLLAKIARATAPSWGYCNRCGMPWKYTKGHAVAYSPTSRCFPLCERCWGSLTNEERLPYYERHLTATRPESLPYLRAQFDRP